MTQRFVSAVAVGFCGLVLAIVCLFGYSRYKAAQVANDAFRAQLVNGPRQGALGTQAPAQLPPRATSVGGEPGGSPGQ
jgi:hypothetical protein